MSFKNSSICDLQQVLRQLQSPSIASRREGRQRLAELFDMDIRRMCAYWLHRQVSRYHYYDYPVRQELDDVIQAVWLVIFEKIDRFEDVEADDVEILLRKWIRTIVWRTVSSHLRRDIHGRQDVALDANMENQAVNAETSAADPSDAVSGDLINRLQSAVNPQEWESLYAHVVEEQSFKDMAKSLNEKAATLRKRKQYAITHLAGYLKRTGEEG